MNQPNQTALHQWNDLFAGQLKKILALKPGTHVIAANVAGKRADIAIGKAAHLVVTKQRVIVDAIIEQIKLNEAQVSEQAKQLAQAPWFFFKRRRRIKETLHQLTGKREGLKAALLDVVNTPPPPEAYTTHEPKINTDGRK